MSLKVFRRLTFMYLLYNRNIGMWQQWTFRHPLNWNRSSYNRKKFLVITCTIRALSNGLLGCFKRVPYFHARMDAVNFTLLPSWHSSIRNKRPHTARNSHSSSLSSIVFFLLSNNFFFGLIICLQKEKKLCNCSMSKVYNRTRKLVHRFSGYNIIGRRRFQEYLSRN